MKKQDLVKQVMEKTGLTETQARQAVEVVFASIQDGLEKAGRVSFTGFGTFNTRRSEASRSRNILHKGVELKKTRSGGTDDPGPSITFKKEVSK